ncbi:MAG: putative HTH-type transcriptional regulator [Thermotoga sp. 47_83]|uniref:Transcriptional regulator, RpiR family n=2 Tax=Thermotoga petrophila TaxID=93929 RepID=A5IK91_THEP1|nr:MULTISPECIES: MurR/RpiR family transcriptional regulator [Thermotoga]KUK23412.1 MAG: putative HTH-type transcriptional regulator [Thermotoga petrophila]KUK33619.1 MAG: putative HTH-type transcriptional regulator [Thermotoga sp. 47_83]HBF69262.1 MurR/RpiR family transcriptional regulator [Thermotoga sp.]ABQ46614.1 transcriptional regulator, RpiR family [Thermotoga petrophila RKU-1]ACB08960.1 transcriptional regulator, RpiR family [Thermotoga sp. RQ2]
MDVIQRIKEKYDEFTNAEKKIADTILSDPKGIIESSISDLSEKAGVKSEASVVKFYKKLGLNSFQQFKVLLAQSISRAPLEIVYEDVSSEDDTKTITEKIFKATVRAILDTLNWMDVDSIEKAVDLFKNAQRIIFIGFAASAAVAFDAFHKFTRIGKNCLFSNDEHIIATILATASPNDLLVAISHTGETISVVNFAKKAKEMKMPVVAITGNRKSTLAKYSNVVLATNTKETKIRTDAMTSRIVQLVILDTIYTLLAARDPRAIEILNRSRLAVSELKY